jgi:predicted nucleic acid-binding protein
MDYLLDTNVLLRWAEPSDPQHALARDVVKRLLRQVHNCYITAQNIVEFWNVATRPLQVNGLGLTPAQADDEAAELERLFPLMVETPDIYTHWRQLVVSAGVSGVQVHDARLVAVMLTYGMTHVLTFNLDDFKRFSEITVVRPQDM